MKERNGPTFRGAGSGSGGAARSGGGSSRKPKNSWVVKPGEVQPPWAQSSVTGSTSVQRAFFQATTGKPFRPPTNFSSPSSGKLWRVKPTSTAPRPVTVTQGKAKVGKSVPPRKWGTSANPPAAKTPPKKQKPDASKVSDRELQRFVEAQKAKGEKRPANPSALRDAQRRQMIQQRKRRITKKNKPPKKPPLWETGPRKTADLEEQMRRDLQRRWDW